MSTPSAAALHLLIDGAAMPAAASPLPGLPPLPHLDALLPHGHVRDAHTLPPDAPATAHEMAHARALGLPGAPGAVPWAAWQAGNVDQPCAWLLPAHVQLSMDSARLLEPAGLRLSPAHAQALRDDCAALLQDDGISLWPPPSAGNDAGPDAAPQPWLAVGELWRDVYAPSPAAALRQPLSRAALAHAPAGQPAQQRQLARLLAELEMLLAAHPVNQAREADGLPPVNTLWLYGAGALPRMPAEPDAALRLDTRLVQLPDGASAAEQAAAWQALDAQHGPALLAAQRAGRAVAISFSGPRSTLTWRSAPRPWWARWLGRWRARPLLAICQRLADDALAPMSPASPGPETTRH